MYVWAWVYGYALHTYYISRPGHLIKPVERGVVDLLTRSGDFRPYFN